MIQEEDFIRQFETCTLPENSFHHRDHVRLVWLYLKRYPLLETLIRFSNGLKRFAEAHGKNSLYHETITWSYVFLIHERQKKEGAEQSWEQFAESNTDLLDWKNNILKSCYREETLRSDLARRIFVFPDKIQYRASPEK